MQPQAATKPTGTLKQLLALAVIVVIGLVIASKDIDKAKLFALLANVKVPYLILASASFLTYLLFEAIAYKYLLRKNGYRVHLRRTYVYALSDFFFSSVSPGGSAGQFGQYYMMQRDRISPAVCINSLFTFNMMYHVALVLVAAVAFVMGVTSQVAKTTPMLLIIVYGIAAQVLFSVGIALLLLSEKVVPRTIRSVTKWARGKRTLKRFAPSREKVEDFLDDYHSSGRRLKKNPMIAVRVTALICCELVFLYAVPWFVALALGYHLNPFYVIAFQSVCVVATESIPLPGGAGASEIFFTSAYSILMPEVQAFGLMLLTRTLTLYLGLIVGGVTIGLTPATVLYAAHPKKDTRPKPAPVEQT